MNKALLFIVLGAALWGTIGWYVKKLYAFEFTPMEVVTLRVSTTAIILTIFTLIKSPGSLKLHNIKDIKYFIGTGIFSIIFFNYCLFSTIELSTIPFATALLYTAPAIVTILSFILFNEKITRIKIIALLLTLFGTCLIVRVIPFNTDIFNLSSVLFGLGSGVGYALYSIFSKYALEKYSSLSISTFTFIIASIALLPFFPYESKANLLLHTEVLLYAFGLGLLPTALAYFVYTYGLKYTEASKASILTTIEPVVATFIGIYIFNENFNFVQIIGMSCIIFSVILIHRYSNLNVRISK